MTRSKKILAAATFLTLIGGGASGAMIDQFSDVFTRSGSFRSTAILAGSFGGSRSVTSDTIAQGGLAGVMGSEREVTVSTDIPASPSYVYVQRDSTRFTLGDPSALISFTYGFANNLNLDLTGERSFAFDLDGTTFGRRSLNPLGMSVTMFSAMESGGTQRSTSATIQGSGQTLVRFPGMNLSDVDRIRFDFFLAGGVTEGSYEIESIATSRVPSGGQALFVMAAACCLVRRRWL